MPRITSLLLRPIFAASLIALSAGCTQNPAMVELHGHQIFGKNGIKTADSLMVANTSAAYQQAPIIRYDNNYSAVQQPTSVVRYDTEPQPSSSATAKITSIGVSDLAPPQKQPEPIKQAALKTQTVESAFKNTADTDAKTANIHPWTGHSREVVLFNAKEEKTLIKDSPAIKQATLKTAEKQTILSNNTFTMKPQKSSGNTTDFIWPVNGKKIISTFGPKGGGKVNDGVNIASASGEPVWASADGEVVYVGNELEGYGNMVIIKHRDSKTTTYAYLSRAIIDKYERVKQGDIIGYVGNTASKKPQLHFAVREGNTPVDPEKFLKRNVASLR